MYELVTNDLLLLLLKSLDQENLLLVKKNLIQASSLLLKHAMNSNEKDWLVSDRMCRNFYPYFQID